MTTIRALRLLAACASACARRQYENIRTTGKPSSECLMSYVLDNVADGVVQNVNVRVEPEEI